MKELALLPFAIELFGDYFLIRAGKKDIPSWARVIMVLLVSVESFKPLTIDTHVLALATSFFMFFDYALNKLRGKRWDYEGSTKQYDIFMSTFNPWFLLTVKTLVFVGLLIYAI